MYSSLFLTIVVVFAVFAIVISGVVSQRQKERIREILAQKGATEIEITQAPYSFDRSNYTYSVKYTDANGKKHDTTCKITGWAFEIYWKDES